MFYYKVIATVDLWFNTGFTLTPQSWFEVFQSRKLDLKRKTSKVFTIDRLYRTIFIYMNKS